MSGVSSDKNLKQAEVVENDDGDIQRGPGPSTADPLSATNDAYGLTRPERNWSKMQKALEQRGYMLRPRYHPGWVGSWVGTKKKPEECEDSIGISVHGVVIDAVRISDGAQVLLKLWSSDVRDAMELPVLQYFSDPVRSTDPQNHCVRILDIVDLPGWTRYFDHILVEPMLCDWQDPPFLIAAEVLSFIRQALEGLAYMHSHNVSHGDIHTGNIMLDPTNIYLKGFRGVSAFHSDKKVLQKGVKRRTRLQVEAKYYYIDFGSSAIFPTVEERKPVPFKAAVFVPPEVEANPDELFDAFSADIYALGLTIVSVIRYRPELRYLVPIFAPMVAKKPEERASVQEMVDLFKTALGRITRRQMRQRLTWTKDVKLSFSERWHYRLEYLKLLWHSFKHGLPKDILLENTKP